MNVTSEVESYLQRCATVRRLSPKTLRAYRADLEQFDLWLRGFGDRLPEQLGESYLAYLNERYKPRSVKRKFTAVRSFARSLGPKAGILEEFTTTRVEARVPHDLPRTVRPEDLRRMLRTAADEYRQAEYRSSYALFFSARTLASVELLTATGMRISELCSLNDLDLDLTDKTCRIMGKGSKERIIQLECQATLTALDCYITARDDHFPCCSTTYKDQRLFVSNLGGPLTEQAARAMIESLADRAGAANHVTPHMIRHTFATLLLEQDVSIRYIQQLLGHSSVKTTEIYTHVSSAKQRQIMRDKNPRDYVNVA